MLFRPRISTCILAAALALDISGCKRALVPEDDATLTRSAQAKLASDASLASEPVQVAVQANVATLNGTVTSDAARALAANDVAQVSGVRTVVNNIVVQPATAISIPPPPIETGRLTHRAKPSADVAQPPPPQAPAPASSQEARQEQAPAPIERLPPTQPAAPASTPPILPPAAFRAITLPPDTTLPIRISQTLDSATTQTGDTFNGSIASDVVVDGLVVLPQGTTVSGRVNNVQEAAHFKGNSLLAIELTRIDGKAYNLPITTDTFSKAGNGRGKNSAEKIGGGAAIGAILGGIFGGGKGAAIGAAAGGGTGAGVQAVTKGQQVQIESESLVRFHLTNPVTVRVATQPKPDTRQDSDLETHDH